VDLRWVDALQNMASAGWGRSRKREKRRKGDAARKKKESDGGKPEEETKGSIDSAKAEDRSVKKAGAKARGRGTKAARQQQKAEKEATRPSEAVTQTASASPTAVRLHCGASDIFALMPEDSDESPLSSKEASWAPPPSSPVIYLLSPETQSPPIVRSVTLSTSALTLVSPQAAREAFWAREDGPLASPVPAYSPFADWEAHEAERGAERSSPRTPVIDLTETPKATLPGSDLPPSCLGAPTPAHEKLTGHSAEDVAFDRRGKRDRCLRTPKVPVHGQSRVQDKERPPPSLTVMHRGAAGLQGELPPPRLDPSPPTGVLLLP
jgi:hypothetical protein